MKSAPVVRCFLCIAIIALLIGQETSAQVANLAAGKKVILNDSLFESGVYQVNNDKIRLLDSIGVLMTVIPELTIELDGYADNRGTAETNKRLSVRRADHARNYLIEKYHLDGNRIVSKGMGSANAIGDNRTEGGRFKNRRVEIVALTPLTKRPVVDEHDRPINEEGHISFLQREVESKPPWAQLFAEAYLNQPFYELHKIRTLDNSRTVLTFNDRSEMKIGDNTMMIIYGSPREERTERKNNIELTNGRLLTKLQSLSPGRKFTVRTPSASIAMHSESRSNIGVNEQEGSNVSIYDGESEVSAENTTVIVPKGYGTSVEKGTPPPQPKPLPPAPQLVAPTTESVLSAARGIAFRWIPSALRTRIEFSSDTAFNALTSSVHSTDSAAFIPLNPGIYYYRLIAIDPGGLESNPDRYARLNVIDSSQYQAKLVLLKPKSGSERVEEALYQLVGSVDSGSRVTINTRNVTPNEWGMFRHACRLEPGENIFSISTVNRYGATKSREVVVEFDEPRGADYLLRITPYVRFDNYQSYLHAVLFSCEGRYWVRERQAIGLSLTAGTMVRPRLPSLQGVPVGNDGVNLWMIHATISDDIIQSGLFHVCVDGSAGPTGWTISPNGDQVRGPHIALSYGAGVSFQFGRTRGFALGTHYYGLVNDNTRLDPMSASNSHGSIGVDLSMIFNQ